MNDFEIRKTRLNIVLKLFYPFLVVLGALIVHFGDNAPNIFDYGNVVFLGLVAFLIVLLFTMTYYMLCELRCLKENNDEIVHSEKVKADTAYDNIFKCFSRGGWGLICNLTVIVISMWVVAYFNKAFEYTTPSSVLLIISLIMCLLFLFLPTDLVLVVSGFKIKFGTTSEIVDEQISEKKFQLSIELGKLRQYQWSAWCILLFNLLYVAWFQ